MNNWTVCTRRRFAILGGLGCSALLLNSGSAHDEVGEPWLQPVPGTDFTYYLVVLDEHGRERLWSQRSCIDAILRRISSENITDLFFLSHGWMGDIPQAKAQYSNWIGAMAKCPGDIEAMRTRKSGFNPLFVGIHWPSLPFGDEELRMATEPQSVEQEVRRFAERTSDTPKAKAAIRAILQPSQRRAPASLPPEIICAFKTLESESKLRACGVAGAPGQDSQGFDVADIYQGVREQPPLVASSSPSNDADSWKYYGLYLLAIVSFWKMKDRARIIGETAGHRLLAAVQKAVPRDRTIRIHLMGHSFGCIVVSSSLQGPPGAASRLKPVDSLALVQGALSHWAYSSNVISTTAPGYFYPIVKNRLVRGPIVTTQSVLDTAVGRLYPAAAGVARQVAMANDRRTFPKYGAIGCHGIRGTMTNTNDLDVSLDIQRTYGLKAEIYNVECTNVIKKQFPVSGSHSDIGHPEIGHLIWEAARVGSEAIEPVVPSPPRPIPPVPKPDFTPIPQPIRPGRRRWHRRR